MLKVASARRSRAWAANDMTGARPKIALIGPYGGGNLGDVAIQEACMQNLRHRGRFEFTAVCDHPENASRVHGISALPISPPDTEVDFGSNLLLRGIARIAAWLVQLGARARFFLDCCRESGRFDLILFSGGGQFDDFWGGPWAHPYSILNWSLAGKVTGTPVAIVSVGVDSLGTVSRLLLRSAARIAKYVSFRDAASLGTARRYRIAGESAIVVPDLAISLKAPDVLSRVNAVDSPGNRRRCIGIGAVSSRAFRPSASRSYDEYLDALAKVACATVDSSRSVLLFVSQTRMDGPLVEKIKQRMELHSPHFNRQLVDVAVTDTLDELCAALSMCDVVVASRLHSAVLSLVLGRPVVAVSYLPKVGQMMSDFGQDQFCVGYDDVTAEALIMRIETIMGNYTETVENITSQLERFRVDLDRQYDRLAELALVGRAQQSAT